MTTHAGFTKTLTEDKHGGHPLGNLAYLFIIGIIAGLGMMVTQLASGNATWAIIGAVVLVVSVVGSVSIMVPMTRRYHHNPLLPDTTDEEVRRYLVAHPR